MIPSNQLSSVLMQDTWLTPDGAVASPILDYEMGGVALNNPVEGLRWQIWALRLEINEDTDVGSFYISAPNHPESFLFSGVGITQGSLAFDQNMNVFVCYLQGGAARYWWFDTVDATQKHSDLPVNSRAPKACIDDKRPLQNGSSDIIMCYTRDNKLYFRAQRDRYTVEYLLKDGVQGQVLKVGMNRRFRLQIAVGEYE